MADISSIPPRQTHSPRLKQFAARLPLAAVRSRSAYHWFVVGTVCIGAFMAALDASIVNIALPTLERTFHVHLSEIEWVSLSYLLTLAAIIVPLGRMADMVGRRWMYALGFTVFIIGSLLCGLSPSLPILIVSRIVQAIGAAMLQANSVSMITAVTPGRDRGKAIGIQASAQGIGLSLGPAVGGALIAFIGWRWIFLVNVPIGIIGTVLGILLLPADEHKSKREPFDTWGALIVAPTLVAFIYFLNAGMKHGWTSPVILASGVIAIVGTVAFLRVERRNQFPLVDLHLFRVPAFGLGSLTGVMSFAVMYAVTLLGPFFLDGIEGLDSFAAGLYMCVIPIGMTLSTPFAGAMADRFGTRPLTVSGMASAALGCVALAFLGGPATNALFLIGLFFIGVGLGTFTPPNNSSVMGSAPSHRLGVAGGILNMSRTLGMSLGVTFGGLSFQLFLALFNPDGTAGHLSAAQMLPAFRAAYATVALLALATMVISGLRQTRAA